MLYYFECEQQSYDTSSADMRISALTIIIHNNTYVVSPYNRAEMYAGRVTSHGEYADGTDRRTDARPLRYAFR